MFTLRKKTIAVTTAAFVIAGTTAALAYWTTTGSGSGTATNATANGTVVLHAAFADGLTPGATRTVAFTGDNAGTSSLRVTTIHLVNATFDSAHSGCLAADFTMPDVLSSTTLVAGAVGAPLAGTGTLTFADTAVDQEACKGAVVTLNLTSS